MSIIFNEIEVVIVYLNSQAVANKAVDIDSSSTLSNEFMGNVSSLIKINDDYYLCVEEIDIGNSDWRPVLYKSTDLGVTWSRVVVVADFVNQSSSERQDGVSMAYDPSTNLMHFVYNSGNTTIYKSLNLLTGELSAADTLTGSSESIGCLASDGAGNFIVTAGDNSSPGDAQFEAFVGGNFVNGGSPTNGSMLAIPNTNNVQQPLITSCAYSKLDSKFHVLHARNGVSEPLRYDVYDPVIDTWTQPTGPFAAINHTNPGTTGERSIVCLREDTTGNIHAVMQGTGGVHYSQYNGVSWSASEVFKTSGESPVVARQPDSSIVVAATVGSVLHVFDRVGVNNYNQLSNSLVVDTHGGTDLGGIYLVDNDLGSVPDPLLNLETIVIAGKHDFVMEQGAEFDRTMRWVDSNDINVSLLLYAIRIQIRELHGGTLISTIETVTPLTTTGEIQRNSPSLGRFNIKLPATKTGPFTFNRALYDIELYPFDGSPLVETGGWTATVFDSAGGFGTIAADGGTPFSPIDDGDLIEVTIPVLSLQQYQGIYEVGSHTSTLLTLTTLLNGTTFPSVSQASGISIQILKEKETVRLFEGMITLNKQSTIFA